MDRPIKILNVAAFMAAAIFASAQLVGYWSGYPANPAPGAAAKNALVAPPSVAAAIQAACDDCHSNRTRWPWYSYVAPVSWWVDYEVSEGRRRLNLSEWADYATDPGTEKNKLDEIATRIRRGDMAPWYYRLMHPSARLAAGQREAILRWVSETEASIARSGNDTRTSTRSGAEEK